MSVLGCTCESAAKLCPAHVEAAIKEHTEDAERAGAAWAESVAARRPALMLQPWPPADGKTMGIAKTKVARWARGDKRLLNILGGACQAAAATRWKELQHEARHQARVRELDRTAALRRRMVR